MKKITSQHVFNVIRTVCAHLKTFATRPLQSFAMRPYILKARAAVLAVHPYILTACAAAPRTAPSARQCNLIFLFFS